MNWQPPRRAFRDLRFTFSSEGLAAKAINKVANTYLFPIEAANDRDGKRW
jgi:hypothetical protein